MPASSKEPSNGGKTVHLGAGLRRPSPQQPPSSRRSVGPHRRAAARDRDTRPAPRGRFHPADGLAPDPERTLRAVASWGLPGRTTAVGPGRRDGSRPRMWTAGLAESSVRSCTLGTPPLAMDRRRPRIHAPRGLGLPLGSRRRCPWHPRSPCDDPRTQGPDDTRGDPGHDGRSHHSGPRQAGGPSPRHRPQRPPRRPPSAGDPPRSGAGDSEGRARGSRDACRPPGPPLSASPRWPCSVLLREILDLEGGPAFTRSEAETRLLELVRGACPPPPRTNERVGRYELDFLWRGAGLALEVDGFAFHASRDRFEADRIRDAELAARGILVIRVTWRQIRDDPAAVIGRVARALGRAEARIPGLPLGTG